MGVIQIECQKEKWLTGGGAEYLLLVQLFARERVTLECSAILISACQDNQVAMDGRKNGLFTEALLRVWDKGRFAGGYHHFRNAIAGAMPPTQSPKYAIVGHRERDFEHQKPFSIVVPRAAVAA